MLLLIDFTHLAGGSLCFLIVCVYVLDFCKKGLKLKQLYNTQPLQFFFTAPVLWALTAGACLGKYQQAAVCLARLTGHSLAHGWILPGVLIGKTPRFCLLHMFFVSVDILLYKHGKVFKEYVGAFFIDPILCNSADRSLPCHPGQVTSILVYNSIEFFECQATRCAEFTTFYANFANKMKVPLMEADWKPSRYKDQVFLSDLWFDDLWPVRFTALPPVDFAHRLSLNH